MPIPHWYKKQRDQPERVNSGLIVGVAYGALILVTVIVVRSR